jgi:hypothetical protein
VQYDRDAILSARSLDGAAIYTIGGRNCMRTETTVKGEMRRCPVCEVYLEKNEGFFCPKCKRGPLCRNHRLPGERVCTGCSFDAKAKELRKLKTQEQNIRGFLRLTQFIFLLFAVFFVSVKIGLFDTVDFLQDVPFSDHLLYAMGIVSVTGFAVFYVILLDQKNKVRVLETDLNNLKFRRLV